MPADERAELATLSLLSRAKATRAESPRQKDLRRLVSASPCCRLIEVCAGSCASKYTRDQGAPAACPQNCGYIIDELLHTHYEDHEQATSITATSSPPSSTLRPRGRLYRSPLRASSSGWPWTACTSWAICSTAARARTAFWTCLMAHHQRGYPVGQPRCRSGWARRRAVAALHR